MPLTRFYSPSAVLLIWALSTVINISPEGTSWMALDDNNYNYLRENALEDKIPACHCVWFCNMLFCRKNWEEGRVMLITGKKETCQGTILWEFVIVLPGKENTFLKRCCNLFLFLAVLGLRRGAWASSSYGLQSLEPSLSSCVTWASWVWLPPWHVGSSQTTDWTHVLCLNRQFLNPWTTREVPENIFSDLISIIIWIYYSQNII